MHATGLVVGAWKAVMDWYHPRGDVEMDHLGKDFENIDMQGDEGPELFFARVQGKANVFTSLGVLTSDRKVVRRITRRLRYHVYDVEQQPTLLQPGIKPSEMNEIVCASNANRKTKALEERKYAAVVSAIAASSVDLHVLDVGGGFQINIGGGGM